MAVQIPVSHEVAEEFSEFGDIITIAAGSGFGALVPVQAVAKLAPLTTKVMILTILCRVVSAGSDQVYFALRRNKFPFEKGFQKIPGVAFDQNPRFEVGLVNDGGEIEIVVLNKSGTTEPGAGPAAPIDVQCGFTGAILRDKVKQGLIQQYFGMTRR